MTAPRFNLTAAERIRLDHIGSNIRERRIAMGMTAKEMCELIHIDVATLHRYESCQTKKADINLLMRIARHLKCDLQELMIP